MATPSKCSRASLDLTEVPDGVTFSNSGDGVVTVNGDEVTDEPIVTHTHELTHVPAVAPTPAKPGNIEYWRCEALRCLLCRRDGHH